MNLKLGAEKLIIDLFKMEAGIVNNSEHMNLPTCSPRRVTSDVMMFYTE